MTLPKLLRMITGMRAVCLIALAMASMAGCSGSHGTETVTPPPPPPPPPPPAPLPDTVSSLGSWTLVLDRPLVSKYEGLAFPDSLHGWVISDRGDILHTTDGGVTWALQASGLGNLRSVDFLDDNRGFAGTLSGILYQTIDAGVTWTNISATLPHTAKGFCGITHLGNNVYIVGKYEGATDYFFSPDAGNSWQYHDLSALAQGMVDVVFLDNNVGFIGGMAKSSTGNLGPATILKTTDGGKNWRTVFLLDGGTSWAWKIFPAAANVLYATIEAQDGVYRVVKSIDGGDNWVVQIVATGQPAFGTTGLQGIGFLDANVGWVGGFFTGMYATTNGGRTWSPVSSVSSANINRYRRAGTTLFTAGTKGILRYDAP